MDYNNTTDMFMCNTFITEVKTSLLGVVTTYHFGLTKVLKFI
jgi:hypothetical protein